MGILTSSPPAAHSPITRVLRVTANVSYSRIQQSLLAKVLAVHVLNAPEAACGNREFLRALWHSHLSSLVRSETHGTRGERPREALEDRSHREGVGGAECDEEVEQRSGW